MKTLVLAIALLVLHLTASAQLYLPDGRPVSGMRFDPPDKPAPPPVIVYMENVDPESARFARILATVQTRYQKLDQRGFLERLRRGVTFTLKSPKNPRQEIRILWSPPTETKAPAP